MSGFGVVPPPPEMDAVRDLHHPDAFADVPGGVVPPPEILTAEEVAELGSSAIDLEAVVDSHEALRAENALLRGPHDAYDENGEPLLPRGWVPIDGGRYDELEAAEARVEALTAALAALVEAARFGHDDAVNEAVDAARRVLADGGTTDDPR